MTTQPRRDHLDIMQLIALQDLAVARASDLPHEQHALMSAGGAPEQSRSCFYEATASTPETFYLSCDAPPGVLHMDIEILFSGNGTVLFTNAADAVGTKFKSGVVYDGTPTPDFSTRVRSGGVVAAANGPSGRAQTVRAVVAWEWTRIDLTMLITPAPELTVYGLSFCPVHVAR